MSKEIIKKMINDFRKNYKLIEEINHYEYIKEHFLGCYTETPKNEVENCYNKYVTTHNSILQKEETRIKSLKVYSLNESQKYADQLNSLNESKILIVKKHSGAYSIVPDVNILIRATYYNGGLEDEIFSKCKDSISELRSEYMYKLYPKVCNEMIEILELNAFTFLTGINKKLQKVSPKNNLVLVDLKLKELSNAIAECRTA